MSEQRLEGFAKAKTATPFIASEQERQDNTLDIGGTCHDTLNFAKRTKIFVIPDLFRDLAVGTM